MFDLSDTGKITLAVTVIDTPGFMYFSRDFLFGEIKFLAGGVLKFLCFNNLSNAKTGFRKAKQNSSNIGKRRLG